MSLSYRGRVRWFTAICAFAVSAGLAVADQHSTPTKPKAVRSADSALDALVSGKVSLNARYRYEYADADGAKSSNANTIRTRLGYGSRPYYGLSFYLEMEDIRAFDDDAYDPNRIESNSPRTFISDPQDTELNQAYLKYVNEERWGLSVIGGRQRIILDDARFVGNVGWRQNEQTYGAINLSSDFNLDGFKVFYAYVWEVNRIFGDREQDGLNPPGSVTRDFDSNSHLINLSYDKLPIGKVTVFAYLLELERKGDEVEIFSTHTFGLRLSGKQDIANGPLAFAYNLSYAYQTDAAGNPRDLEAHYYLLEGSLIYRAIGQLTVGYEVLGADGRTQAFSTPLATLHKFQGFADALLVLSLTGGPVGAGAGIRDVYIAMTPTMLPFGLKGKVVYHFYQSDEGGVDIGSEFNAVLSKKINKHLSVLAKYAHYNADDFSVDLDRFWLQVTLKF